MLSFPKTFAAFPYQLPLASQHRPLTLIRSNTDGGNDFTSSEPARPTIMPPETVEIRFKRGSRRRRKQQEEGVGAERKPEKVAKKWEDMSLSEKALELYVGEKGALFWLNKFAYASIFIVIGGWIVFRFVGPALNLYQLDTPPLPPSSMFNDLEEVFTYPFKHTNSCLDKKPLRRRAKDKATATAKVMDVLGLLRIRVRRGINLAVRDTLSSDPYCVVSCETQRVKTKVIRGNCNPAWNEELTIYIKDFASPITLSVYDKDTFTVDDSMGTARVDIKPLIHCLKLGLESLPDGTKVERVQPTKENCLSDESSVVWNKGKMTQDMILRLNDVECGEVEVQIEWIEIPGCKGIKAA